MAQKFTLGKTLVWPVVVLVIAFGAFYLKPWQSKPQETISVSATGSAKTVPNVAQITATIESKNPNIDQARIQTDTKVSDIINTIKGLGIPEKDIKTQNVSAGQSYETQIYPPKRPSTNQYSVSLSITLRDFKLADQVLATLTRLGATNLYGPNLQVDDNDLEKAKSQARENAVNNAKQKAKELAGASGRKIGKVISIKEQGDYAIPMPLYTRGGADLMEKAASIQPGQDEVTITLLIDFSLK